MKNIGEWIHNYQNLSFEQQCEVAKAIVESIGNKQHHFMEKKKELIEVVDFFNRIIDSAEQKQIIEGKTSIIKRFENLSQANKEKALMSIINIIEETVKEQTKENQEDFCQQEGHHFGKWEKVEYTDSKYIGTENDSIYDHNGYLQQFAYHNFKKHRITEWRRYCQRCGFVEKSAQEPLEVRVEREKRTREEKIKYHQNEIKRLTRQQD